MHCLLPVTTEKRKTAQKGRRRRTGAATSVTHSASRVLCCGRFGTRGQLGNLQPSRHLSSFLPFSLWSKEHWFLCDPRHYLHPGADFILPLSPAHHNVTITHSRTPSCVVYITKQGPTHFTTLIVQGTGSRMSAQLSGDQQNIEFIGSYSFQCLSRQSQKELAGACGSPRGAAQCMLSV